MTEILVQVGFEERLPPVTRVVEHPAWPVLKDAVERIRPWQSKDGSIDFDAEGAPGCAEAESAVRRVTGAVEELSRWSRTTPRTTRRSSGIWGSGPTTASRCPTSWTRCWPSSPP